MSGDPTIMRWNALHQSEGHEVFKKEGAWAGLSPLYMNNICWNCGCRHVKREQKSVANPNRTKIGS